MTRMDGLMMVGDSWKYTKINEKTDKEDVHILRTNGRGFYGFS